MWMCNRNTDCPSRTTQAPVRRIETSDQVSAHKMGTLELYYWHERRSKGDPEVRLPTAHLPGSMVAVEMGHTARRPLPPCTRHTSKQPSASPASLEKEQSCRCRRRRKIASLPECA